MNTNEITIKKNIKLLNKWIDNVYIIFSIINIIMLLLSQISTHGSLSYSSILLTSLLLRKEETMFVRICTIAVIIHWYKSALDNTLVVNMLLSIILSIEFLVCSTLFNVKNRLENELSIYMYKPIIQKQTNTVFPYIINYIVFLDFAIFNVNILTLIVLISALYYDMSLKSYFIQMLVRFIAFVDCILMFCAIPNEDCYKFRFENAKYNIIYILIISIIYLVLIIYEFKAFLKT